MVDIYSKLNAWQKTQVARHPQRPHFVDYAKTLFQEFTPLAGDRKFSEDAAIQAGLARFRGQPIAVIGQEKGSDTKSRLKHNFGSARPEGYRKAIRILEMADRFGLPVVTLVDTAGAYPGVGAEERGQAEAIARSTEMCLGVKVPIISVIIGEGGSGGAIAIATGNKVYMLEHSIYSVISPEGAASILWRDSTRAREAATNMKITAEDLKSLGVIDGIIPEPLGGAHRDPDSVISRHRRCHRQRPGRTFAAFRRTAAQGPPPEIPRHGPESLHGHPSIRRPDCGQTLATIMLSVAVALAGYPWASHRLVRNCEV